MAISSRPFGQLGPPLSDFFEKRVEVRPKHVWPGENFRAALAELFVSTKKNRIAGIKARKRKSP